MKKNWKAIAITVVAASVLVYPAMLLARYIARKRAENADNEAEEVHTMKAFIPAFRGKRKHHRTEHNGHPDAGLA
jgi:hypothetical protein